MACCEGNWEWKSIHNPFVEYDDTRAQRDPKSMLIVS